MKHNIFKNKKILITGHTGFKGAWLLKWLSLYTDNIYGISKDIPTKPSVYNSLHLKKSLKKDYRFNIIDKEKIQKIFNKNKFDFVFHLAAQPLLFESYEDPVNTINTNVIGTVNILNSLKSYNHKCIGIIITSDKCYENNDENIAFKENNRLGGKDIYGASKASAEILFNAYFNSFFLNSKVKIATVRAGNVIGGGDWAKYRIIPDFFKSIIDKKILNIRNPNSTRPWQHVLEPLNGYLMLAEALHSSKILNGESFNFGPIIKNHVNVVTLITDLKNRYKNQYTYVPKIKTKKSKLYENNFLRLNIEKSINELKWKPILSYKEMINFTCDWYGTFINNKKNIQKIMEKQINHFEKNL